MLDQLTRTRTSGNLEGLVRRPALSCHHSVESETIERNETSTKKIDQLDLSDVKIKLCFPESKGGKGWLPEQAIEVEIHYKEFLKECLIDKKVSPDSDVDQMWHTHILFTHQYQRDCDHIFGYFLHHTPNLKTGGCCKTTQGDGTNDNCGSD